MAFTPLTGTIRTTVTTTAAAITCPASAHLVLVTNGSTVAAGNILYADINTTAVIPVNGGATGATPILPQQRMLIDKGMATTLSLIGSAASTDALVTFGSASAGSA
jgi:hypothetical protein